MNVPYTSHDSKPTMTAEERIHKAICLLEQKHYDLEQAIIAADKRHDAEGALEAMSECAGICYALSLLRFNAYLQDEYNRVFK